MAVHGPAAPAVLVPRDAGPEIYLTGFVLRNSVTQQDVLVDLTTANPSGVPLVPNLPLLFAHEAKLHVRHEVNGKLHDYRVLLGPDPESDAFAAGQIKTSVATMNLTAGWTILIGQGPIAQTELVSTSPEGTVMAVRIQAQPNQHYVYNLEPPGSRSVVNVEYAGQTIVLQPGQYLSASPRSGTMPTPQAIPSGDPFVAHMRARAAVAQFDLGPSTRVRGG
jgi:hypothetical protein